MNFVTIETEQSFASSLPMTALVVVSRRWVMFHSHGSYDRCEQLCGFIA